MVSWPDLLRAYAEGLDATSGAPGLVAVSTARPDQAEVALRDCSARDVMTPLVFSVVESTVLARAISLKSMMDFQPLPVVLGDGSVGGILSNQSVKRRLEQ